MAATPSPTTTPASTDTDLIIVGGGPAGCAAARMAASVDLSSILVEPNALCHSLYRISALNNVLGGHTSGPNLAHAITAELADTKQCRIEAGRRATRIRAHDDHVAVTLDTGTVLTAPYTVIATGVGPLQPQDTPWVTAPVGLSLPPLWRADATEAEDRTLLVLGADRPIGTFLRAHPSTNTRLLIAHPESDDYKTQEIRDDPRVTLLPTQHLTLLPAEAPATAELVDRSGGRHTVTADATYLSIGTAPTTPPGDLIHSTDGYCHPSAQHHRLLIAGDLRSARHQRIMTALGSGSEAALNAYYASQGLPDPDGPGHSQD